MSETMSVGASFAWTREVVRNWGRWTRSHLLMTLGLSALAFAIGWVWNTYIMAVSLEGSAVGPDTQTAATADGHTGNGLFWLLLFSLAGGLVTYAWSRGWRNFWADMAALPRRFGEGIASSPTGAFAMLLWGASVSLLISTLISSAVSLALGLVLLALAATPVGVILNFALIRLWRGLSGIVAPNAGPRLALMVSPLMVMLGEAFGLFLDWMIGGWLIGLALGVACAVMSVVLVRAVPPRAAVVLVVVGAAVAWQVLRVRWAYADDGGWSECVTADGQPCSEAGLLGILDWLRSAGAGHVVARGAVGGAFAGLGAVLGVGIGGALAGLAVAAAQTSTSGQASGPASGSADGQAQPGPAEGQRLAGGADGQPPAQRSAGTPRETTSWPGAPQQEGTLYQSALHEGGPPGPGAGVGQPDVAARAGGGQPDAAAPAGGGQPDAAAPAGVGQPDAEDAGRVGHGYQFEVSDILPEEPDREDDEEDGGPTRQLPPQR